VKRTSLFPDARATELLRAMLLDGDAAREAWSRWRAQVAGPMRALGGDAVMARPLLPLLYDSVRRNALPVDDATATYLRSAFLTESLRSRKYREIVAELLALHRVVLIKGAAIGELYYADLALRHAHDVEVLAEDVDALRASLVGSRFRPAGNDFVHESGLPLRVHVARAPIAPRDASAHLAHSLIHASRSRSRHSARWACDAFMIARSGSVSWRCVLEIVIAEGAAVPASAQLRWLHENLGVGVPDEMLATIATRARKAGVRERLRAFLARAGRG